MPITDEQIQNWFTSHALEPVDVGHTEAIRDAAKQLANVINQHAPDSDDKTAAIRKVREAMMTANASIACKGQ